MKINQYYSVILLFMFLISCSLKHHEKLLETHGDRKIKESRTIDNNLYIGVSEKKSNIQQAINNAIENAQMQIVHDLGVFIDFSIVVYNLELENENEISHYQTFEKNIKISGQYKIDTKINRYYVEKRYLNKETYYIAWVQIPFSKENFYEYYNNKWSSIYHNHFTDKLFILNRELYDKLLEFNLVYENFEQESEFLYSDLQNKLKALYLQINSYYHDSVKKIIVSEVSDRHKFSNNFVLEFRYLNEVLANFPIRLCDEVFYTDNNGIISYQANYQKELVISPINFDNFSKEQYIIYYNKHFTPFIKSNYNISVESDNQLLTKGIGTFLLNNDFNIKIPSDIIITANYKSNIKMIAINSFYAKTNIELLIKNNLKQTTLIINNVEGYGKTSDKALENSFSLEWYLHKTQLPDKIEKAIIQILTM